MATITDIARECGVSKSTVSYVVNNGPKPVHPETRDRVLEAINRLDYRPNAIARSLNRRCTGVFGIYLCDENDNLIKVLDPYFAEVFSGIEIGCKERGKDWLVHTLSKGSSAEGIYTKLVNGQIDGLILLGKPDRPLRERLASSSLPVVTLTDPLPSIPSVCVDDAAGALLMADYLAGKGHRRVLYRMVQQEPAAVRRHNAFLQAAASMGMTVLEFREAGYQPMLNAREIDCLRAPVNERPTAIVCWNDFWAHCAILGCRGLGLRVPDDLAVAGFDGFEQYLPPPAYHLTTIRAPWMEAARTAVDLLAACLEGEQIPMETVLPVELVAGGTA